MCLICCIYKYHLSLFIFDTISWLLSGVVQNWIKYGQLCLNVAWFGRWPVKKLITNRKDAKLMTFQMFIAIHRLLANFPNIIPTKLQFSCSFRARYYINLDQSETRIAHGGHLWSSICTKWRKFIADLPLINPVKFGSIQLSNFKGED